MTPAPHHDVVSAYYGDVLLMRTPAPVNINKAGANYKSEVPHIHYSPRDAYLEWLSICEGFSRLGVDVIFDFEDEDRPFLDCGDLFVDESGAVLNKKAQTVGHMDAVATGRVFTANGPWVIRDGSHMRALLPNMLPHRAQEQGYFERLLNEIAATHALDLTIEKNPFRWEGLADVSVVGDKVLFTYTTQAHYAPDYAAKGKPKSLRSSLDGVRYAAQWAGLESDRCCHAELIYPHFHGDTAHFALTDAQGLFYLAQYEGALWREDHMRLKTFLSADTKIFQVSQSDAVDAYATNTRFVQTDTHGPGVLIPSGASAVFRQSLREMGLNVETVSLYELFGKAGGGPACASLYLPKSLALDSHFKKRYTLCLEEVRRYVGRLPQSVTVSEQYFQRRMRG